MTIQDDPGKLGQPGKSFYSSFVAVSDTSSNLAFFVHLPMINIFASSKSTEILLLSKPTTKSAKK